MFTRINLLTRPFAIALTALLLLTLTLSIQPIQANQATMLDLSFTGLTDLGADYVYEGWVMVDGEAVTAGRFTVDADGNPSETMFAIDSSATAYILTIEPAMGDDPAPSAVHLLAGDIVDSMATLTIDHDAAIATDFASAMGSFILAAPTAADGDGASYLNGIWWLDPTGADGPVASLDLPMLPDGWVYEGWVAGADGPISTGTFTSTMGADSDGAGATAGTGDAPAFPGQDFIMPDPIDLTGYRAVISVEPVPDNHPDPFSIKPLVSEPATDPGMAGVLQAMGNNMDGIPSGTATVVMAADMMMTEFEIKITNSSNHTIQPSPYSPGAWAVHTMDDPIFTAGMADRGEGLEAIAEGGDPTMLADSLSGMSDLLSSGTIGSPIPPGESLTFSVMADDPSAALSFATMFVASNDLFLGPDGMGIALFDAEGMPVSGDVTDQIALWDAGTEVNEAPGNGPNQPLNGGGATGAAEGSVSPFTNSTRALPPASNIATFMVADTGSGGYMITLNNVSGMSGAFDTPIAPVFYAVHDASWSLFTAGMPDVGDGLETLAEDGAPTDLLASYTSALDGIALTGSPGMPAGTGETQTFTVTASTSHPYLSLAAMVVASNDAFLAPPSTGIMLVDDSGMARPAADIEADLNSMVVVWDAGTEANEVPGAGPHQPLIGGGATGAADPDNTVRHYSDTTNDLASGDYFDLSITPLDGTMFRIELMNTSGGTAYEGALAPLFAAQHNSNIGLFETGSPAIAQLESLAEDGSPAELLTLSALDDVSMTSATDAPVMPGGSHVLTVTMDAAFPVLSLSAMVVPSNDAFVAFGGEGITLLDDTGNAISQDAIDMMIADSFIVWDAGTEQNQTGAAGPDQAGAGQTAAGQGANEGDGTVRLLNDPVYNYPAVADLVQVMISPVMPTPSPADEIVIKYSSCNVPPLGGGAFYEGWFIQDGVVLSAGQFTVDENGVLSQSVFPISVMDKDAGATFVLTIEPAGDTDPGPSDTHLLGGDFANSMNDSIVATIDHSAALGTDFSTAAGSYILAVPTAADGDGADYNNGIWFLDMTVNGTPTLPAPSLDLPTLPAGWVYEGWVVVDGTPVSTGTFTSTIGADSDGAGPTAGANPAPPFPGQDFVTDMLDLIDGTAVISVEPLPDDSAAPFVLKPLVDMTIEDVGAGGAQTLANNATDLPTCTVEVMAPTAASMTNSVAGNTTSPAILIISLLMVVTLLSVARREKLD